MPIKNISEVRRLHRLGKVRLGAKKLSTRTGKEYPDAWDHFNFKDTPELSKLFGDNCKEFEIMVPCENINIFFPQERKAYRSSSSGPFCRGDGEIATRVNVGLNVEVDYFENGKTSKRLISSKVPKGQPLDPSGLAYIKEQGLTVGVGEMFDLPCLGDECAYTCQKFCKPVGRFLFLVPSAPRVGVYEISSSSINGMIDLNSALAEGGTIRGIAGRVSMIPLTLMLVPKECNIEGKKKTIHYLQVEYRGTFAQLMQYRSAKAIPDAQLPSRLELDREVPDDLMPQGGKALEAQVGSATPPAPEAPSPHGEPAGQEQPPNESYVPGEDAGEIEGPGLGTPPGAQESREVQGELLPPAKPAAPPARHAQPAKPAAPAGPKKPSRQLFR